MCIGIGMLSVHAAEHAETLLLAVWHTLTDASYILGHSLWG